jgi:peroxidase
MSRKVDIIYIYIGAHAIGVSHCSSFENRIRKFNATHDIDPSLQPSFAQSLRGICPINNRNPVTQMVPPANTFNNTYYKLVLEGKGLFSSDHALLSTPKTKELVSKFASSPEAFRKAFAASMIKMSSIVGGEEIRRNCRVIN